MLELKDGFVLYHGSYCEVKEPDLAKCAKRKDFGQGFYLTTSKEQAESFLRTSIAKAIATGTIEEGQKFGYISTFEFNLSGNLETHIYENADVDWLHCIAAHRKKKCLSKLNVKWQGMISLQERLRMMQQTLPLLLTLPGLSGQQAIRRQTISASDSYCPIN